MIRSSEVRVTYRELSCYRLSRHKNQPHFCLIVSPATKIRRTLPHNRQTTMTMKRRLFTSMLAINHATSIASAFISLRNLQHCNSEVGLPRDLLVPSTSPGRRRCRSKKTPLQMNYKSPDEINSYNDDAFGLVFLTGGVLSQDVDFVASFAALSAIAAMGTNVGLIEKDERAPAAVAMLTLLITPAISSLR
jgi:hypothetical protein